MEMEKLSDNRGCWQHGDMDKRHTQRGQPHQSQDKQNIEDYTRRKCAWYLALSFTNPILKKFPFFSSVNMCVHVQNYNGVALHTCTCTTIPCVPVIALWFW